MSLSQQIRDALRDIGGPATRAEISDHLGEDADRNAISKVLHNLEESGVVVVNRLTNPYTFTLDEKRAAAQESHRNSAHAPKREAVAKTPKSAFPSVEQALPAQHRGDELQSVHAHAQGQAQLAGPPAQRQTLEVDRALAIRLCILALSSRDDLSADDRGDIAAVIKAAA